MAALTTTANQRMELVRWLLFTGGRYGSWEQAFRLHSGTPPTEANKVSTADRPAVSSMIGDKPHCGPNGGRIAVPSASTTIAAIALWYRKGATVNAAIGSTDPWSLMAYEADAYVSPSGQTEYTRLPPNGWEITFPKSPVFGTRAFQGSADQGGFGNQGAYPWFLTELSTAPGTGGANPQVINALNLPTPVFAAHSGSPPTAANLVGASPSYHLTALQWGVGTGELPVLRVSDAVQTISWTGAPRVVGPQASVEISRVGSGGTATHLAIWFPNATLAGDAPASWTGVADALVASGALENNVDLSTASARLTIHANSLSIRWDAP